MQHQERGQRLYWLCLCFHKQSGDLRIGNQGKGAAIQLLGGGGLECLNWTNYLFHFMSAILYLVHTLFQAKCLFHFLEIYCFLSTKLDSKLGFKIQDFFILSKTYIYIYIVITQV